MRLLDMSHDGLLQVLCQLSAMWFSFGFVSENEMKWNQEKNKIFKKNYDMRMNKIKTKWKQNENKINIKKMKK